MASWPESDSAWLDEDAEEALTLLMELVRGIRNRRAEYRVTPGKRIPALISAGEKTGALVAQHAELCALAKLDPVGLVIEHALQPPSHAATIVAGDVTCYLPLAEIVDLEAEQERLANDLADAKHRIGHSEGLLAGQFAERAPEDVVQRERDKLAELKAERDKLLERLEALG